MPDAPAAEVFFPEDFEVSYTQVRNCRRSIDHDLRYILVWADDLAAKPYLNRAAPFPTGATLVKIEHEDELCTKVTGYTAMQKQEVGAAPEAGDWRWQRVTLDRVSLEDPLATKRCAGCHAKCGVPPDGYEGTCAVP